MSSPLKINEDTKIAELIRANKTSIEVLANVARPFYRLRNPVLRKIMASRVTIAEAAKMGRCSIQDIMDALAPLGFVYERKTSGSENTVKGPPDWLKGAGEEKILRYDVRPIIESGTDPLKEILSMFKNVPPGGILCIINHFIPTPLIHLLAKEKAEDSYVAVVSEKEYHTYFLKRKTVKQPDTEEKNKVFMQNADSFDEIYKRFPAANIRETDVRRMEMPMPMQIILEALAGLPDGHMLYVHHKRIPVYLLEELAEKDYEIHIHTIDEKNVKMILFRKAS